MLLSRNLFAWFPRGLMGSLTSRSLRMIVCRCTVNRGAAGRLIPTRLGWLGCFVLLLRGCGLVSLLEIFPSFRARGRD